MPTAYSARILPKALAFWAIFMGLYGVYRFFPSFPLSIICGINETVFQHLKAGFVAYLILTGLEALRYRGRIAAWEGFLYARLQTALFLPWVILLVWYIVPATLGQLSIPLEIVWANVSLLLAVGLTLLGERSWETATYSRAHQGLLWGLIVLSAALYVRFTFGPLPWADVFVEPNWR